MLRPPGYVKSIYKSKLQTPWWEAPHRPISGIPPYSPPPLLVSPYLPSRVLAPRLLCFLSLFLLSRNPVGQNKHNPGCKRENHPKTTTSSALAGPPSFYNHFLPTSSPFALLRSDQIAVTGFLLSQVVALLLLSDSSRPTPSSVLYPYSLSSITPRQFFNTEPLENLPIHTPN